MNGLTVSALEVSSMCDIEKLLQRGETTSQTPELDIVNMELNRHFDVYFTVTEVRMKGPLNMNLWS